MNERQCQSTMRNCLIIKILVIIAIFLSATQTLSAQYPADLWVSGNISGMDYSQSQGVKCANLGDGKYQALVYRVMNDNGSNTGKYHGNFKILTSLSGSGNTTIYGASSDNHLHRFTDGETGKLVSSAQGSVGDYSLPDKAGNYMLDIDLANNTIKVSSSYVPQQMFLIRNMSDGSPQTFASTLSLVSQQEYAGYELPMYYQVSDNSSTCYYYISAAIGSQWSVINAERYGMISYVKHENGTITLTDGAEGTLGTQKEGTYDISFNRGTKELTIKTSYPDLYLVGAVNGMDWNGRGDGEKIKFVQEEGCYYATIVPNVSSGQSFSFAFTSRSGCGIAEADAHRYAGTAENEPIDINTNVLCRADVHNVTSSYAVPGKYSGVPLYARIDLNKQTMLLQTTPFAKSDNPKGVSYNQVWSPDGKILLVSIVENGKPYYMVMSNNEWVINKSPLGLVSETADYTQNLTYISSEKREINETYTLPSGKTSTYVNNSRELTLHTQTSAGQPFDIIFRVSNDGVAFRYAIPNQDGKTSIVINDEASAVYPSDYKYILGQKFASRRSGPNFPYESYYGKHGVYGEYTNWTEAVTDENEPRFNSPIMIGSGNQHILISEAENVGTYSLSLLKAYQSPTGCIMWQHAGDSYQTNKADGKMRLTVKLPLETPWRTLQIGDLSTIFASTMQENLCKPTEMTDLSWIEPGVVSWDWGGNDGASYKPLTRYEADKKYIDMAASMGWKYVLIDGGWNENDIQNTVNYAESKGIKVILWMTAKLTESTQFSTENMEGTLRNWKQWGIVGVKIDFWEDDSRETMERMELLLKLTAKYQMNVNFHGCTRPSGLRRTYPHLLSYEGILGGENNFWEAEKYMIPSHNINSVLTRNVIGSADYTPVDFAMITGRLHQRYSFAHNLGLSVAIENGLLHVCESYKNLLPYGPSVILKRVPVAWDESRLLEGKVSQYVTIARRKGSDWWLVGLTVSPRTASIDLSTLLTSGKTYTAYIYRDGDTRNKILVEKQTVSSTSTLSIDERDGGGFLVQISENANLEMPIEEVTYEAESSANELTGLSVDADNALYASGGKKVGNIGMGRQIVFKNINVSTDGFYTVTIYYTANENRQASYAVNGKNIGSIEFPGHGMSGYSMENGSIIRRDVAFKAGNNTFSIIAPSGGWSPDIDRITVSAKQIADINTVVPENLYVVGAVFENQSWKDTYTEADVFKCYNAGNGIFHVNLWTSDVSGHNAFSFSSALGSSDTMLANRFGACVEQTVLQPGNKTQFVSIPASGSFYFSLPKANTMYYATIDINAGKISIREASETELPDVIYMVHSTNAGPWNLYDASQPALINENGEYIFTNVHIEKEGQYECGWYRFVSSPTGATGCMLDNFFGSLVADDNHFVTQDKEIKLNREFSSANSSFSPYGVYNIVLSTRDSRIRLTGQQSYPEKLYLVGNVDYRTFDTAGNDLIKCYNAGNGVYYVTINYEAGTTDDGSFYFTVNPNDAQNTNFKYSGKINAETIGMNTTTYCGSALENTAAYFKLSATGKYYATINLASNTLTLSDEPNVLFLVQNKSFDERYNCNWNLYDESKVLTCIAPLQYAAKGIELKPEKDSDKCYFNFTTILPEDDISLDWSWKTVKIDRWGNNETFVPGLLTADIKNDKEVLYNGPAGRYNIIVDLNVNTILLYSADTEDYEGYKIRLVNGRAADYSYNGTMLTHSYKDGMEYYVADFDPYWNIGATTEWPQLLLEKDGCMLMHGMQGADCITDSYREISIDKSFTGRTYINPDKGPFQGLIVKVENGSMWMYMSNESTGVENVSSDTEITIESGIGYIKVSGTDVYTITTLSGISTISASATTNVAPGLYIVKAGNKVQKVIVK